MDLIHLEKTEKLRFLLDPIVGFKYFGLINASNYDPYYNSGEKKRYKYELSSLNLMSRPLILDMDKLKRRNISDEEANKMLREIFKEDILNNEDEDEDTDETELCSGDCTEENSEKKFCECVRIAENSSRFSLRVMEAMKWLQQNDDTLMPTSSVEDIVDYIRKNYRDGGDLFAQVRTTMKQVCSQGFVMELMENEYHLVGPDAISMNQITYSTERIDCPLSSPIKKHGHRKRKEEKDDSCECDQTDEEDTIHMRKNRKISMNERRNVPQTQNENHIDDIVAEGRSTSSDTLTLSDDECVCENEMQNIVGNSKAYGKQQRTNNEESEAVFPNANDIYRELEKENPRLSKKDEKELKEWIKRCQEECMRRNKRQG